MIKKIKDFVYRKHLQLNHIEAKNGQIFDQLQNDLKSSKVNLGQIQSQLNNKLSFIRSLAEVEFQVFSQWGDDGIIQYLVNNLEIPHKTFVEFGVENYKESNTRFLLIKDKWAGLVIDGLKANIDYIKKDPISWAYHLYAKHAFITKNNINHLIREFLSKGYDPEIGILSVDIDGNDYWIWEVIDCVNPIITIVEYNSVFGAEKALTIPYEENFYRLDGDNTYQYWGASLQAFCFLAEKKGYHFVGCNSNGNNAYFIRKDKIGKFKPISAKEGFVQSTFREYIDQQGERVGGSERIKLIHGKPVVNVATGKNEVINDADFL